MSRCEERLITRKVELHFRNSKPAREVCEKAEAAVEEGHDVYGPIKQFVIIVSIEFDFESANRIPYASLLLNP
jgi:hypothetical protein